MSALRSPVEFDIALGMERFKLPQSHHPKDVAEQLHLAPGDILDWEIISDKGKKSVKVRKLE